MAIEDFVFSHATRRVVFGVGALAKLAGLAEEAGARSAAVVVDGFFLEGPVADRVRDILAPVLSAPPRFHGIAQKEPDLAMVRACADFLAAEPADMVVAVGGGSAIDTAKVGRMLVANPGDPAAIAGPVGAVMAPHKSLFVCVPTTAGTGSEVSDAALVSADDSEYKLIYRHHNMAAAIALLDPELTVSSPPVVTACSGFDAVTHAVEAFVSKMAGPMTDPFARSAMERLARWLPRAYRAADDLEARGHCLIAAMQAGIAFNSAHLGLAHAISGAMGARHHTPHGLANALALPWVMAFNEGSVGDKAAAIRQAFGGETAAEGLSRLRAALDLDLSLDDFVDGEEARDRLAAAAMTSGQVRVNPRPATVDDMRAILEAMRRPTGGGRPVLER